MTDINYFAAFAAKPARPDAYIPAVRRGSDELRAFVTAREQSAIPFAQTPARAKTDGLSGA